MKSLKIYLVCISIVMTVLLAAQLGLLIYGGLKVKDESASLSSKVNSFNQSVDRVNQNLKQINTQLQKENAGEQSALSQL